MQRQGDDAADMRPVFTPTPKSSPFQKKMRENLPIPDQNLRTPKTDLSRFTASPRINIAHRGHKSLRDILELDRHIHVSLAVHPEAARCNDLGLD